MDCNPPGSSVHGILQARVLEWVAMPSSRGSSQPRDRAHISYGSCTAGRFFTAETPGRPRLWDKHVLTKMEELSAAQMKRGELLLVLTL